MYKYAMLMQTEKDDQFDLYLFERSLDEMFPDRAYQNLKDETVRKQVKAKMMEFATGPLRLGFQAIDNILVTGMFLAYQLTEDQITEVREFSANLRNQTVHTGKWDA